MDDPDKRKHRRDSQILVKTQTKIHARVTRKRKEQAEERERREKQSEKIMSEDEESPAKGNKHNPNPEPESGGEGAKEEKAEKKDPNRKVDWKESYAVTIPKFSLVRENIWSIEKWCSMTHEYWKIIGGR